MGTVWIVHHGSLWVVGGGMGLIRITTGAAGRARAEAALAGDCALNQSIPRVRSKVGMLGVVVVMVLLAAEGRRCALLRGCHNRLD